MNFFIEALAVWYVSHLLVNERGLFGVFDTWRKIIGIREGEYGESVAVGELALLFTCACCLGLWTAIIATALLHHSWHYVFAYAGVACLLNRHWHN